MFLNQIESIIGLGNKNPSMSSSNILYNSSSHSAPHTMSNPFISSKSNSILPNSLSGLDQIQAIRSKVNNTASDLVKCPHTDKKPYAKGMCHNCYHKRGKSKMAHACGHTTKPHYSNGLCQNCYLAQYYQKRKAKQQQKALEQKTLKEGINPS